MHEGRKNILALIAKGARYKWALTDESLFACQILDFHIFFQKKKVFCAKKSLYGENTLILIRSSDIFFIFSLDHPDFFWILEMKTSFFTKIPFFGLWAPFIENEGWLVEWMEKGWKCEISKGGTTGCMEYLQFHYVIFISGEI